MVTKPMRPMPSDFAEKAAVMGQVELIKHYKCGKEALLRWHRENGVKPIRRTTERTMPADFAQCAKVMNKDALGRHYKTSDRIIRRWLAKSGVTAARTFKSRLMRAAPEDFVTQAAVLTQRALSELYNTSLDIVQRWMRETGAVRIVPPKPPRPQASGMIFRGHPGFRIDRTDLRLKSALDEAADVIRRERFAVFRCDDRGVYADKGELWRVGRSILTGDELLQRADKYRRRAA